MERCRNPEKANRLETSRPPRRRKLYHIEQFSKLTTSPSAPPAAGEERPPQADSARRAPVPKLLPAEPSPPLPTSPSPPACRSPPGPVQPARARPASAPGARTSSALASLRISSHASQTKKKQTGNRPHFVLAARPAKNGYFSPTAEATQARLGRHSSASATRIGSRQKIFSWTWVKAVELRSCRSDLPEWYSTIVCCRWTRGCASTGARRSPAVQGGVLSGDVERYNSIIKR